MTTKLSVTASKFLDKMKKVDACQYLANRSFEYLFIKLSKPLVD